MAPCFSQKPPAPPDRAERSVSPIAKGIRSRVLAGGSVAYPFATGAWGKGCRKARGRAWRIFCMWGACCALVLVLEAARKTTRSSLRFCFFLFRFVFVSIFCFVLHLVPL